MIQLTPKQIKILSITLLVIFFSMGASWLTFLLTPLITADKGLRYNVRDGATLRAVVEDLYLKGIIKHPDFFKLLVRMKGITHELKAGQYLFAKGTRPGKLLEQLITGNGMVYHSFTIIPGKTFKDMRASFARDSSFKHTIDAQTDKEIMTRLDHPELAPEGQFYPDTYFFADGTPDIVILKKAFKTMQDKVAQAWQKRALGLPFKAPYQALIAASIIEKESYLEKELPRIAGVMVNRLRKNMLLQFDPTVIYGVGDAYTGKIRRSDLTANNPYNTYVHKGLPPTPICMPSMAALQATLHPEQHEYYYFVAQSNGTSQFNKGLAEHHKAVEATRQTKEFFNVSLTRYYLRKMFFAQLAASVRGHDNGFDMTDGKGKEYYVHGGFSRVFFND